MLGGNGVYTFPLSKAQGYVSMVTVDMFNPIECIYLYDFHASSICFVKQNILRNTSLYMNCKISHRA